MTQSRPSATLQIQPHKQMAGANIGDWLDLSSNVMTLRRTYDMSVGSFTAQVKLPRDSWEKSVVEMYVREGDPVVIRLSNDPSIKGKLFYGLSIRWQDRALLMRPRGRNRMCLPYPAGDGGERF
jgi:hypothetical protein